MKGEANMARLTPLNYRPPGSGLHPMERPGSGKGLPAGPNGPATESDPVLLAEALTKMRDKLQRRGETGLRDIVRSRDPYPEWNIWSWDREVRIGLGAAAALAPLLVQGCELWFRREQLMSDGHGGGRIDGEAIRLLRLVAPPNDLFKFQSQKVIQAAAARGDVTAEIVIQHQDLWPFFAAITHIETDASPRTAELLAVAFQTATQVAMQVKHELACPRPIDVSVHVNPAIRTPGHSALPGGHATIAFMFVRIVSALLDGPCESPSQVRRLLFRLAHRISHHRVVAGVHFPVDAVAGRLLGEVLADCFLTQCGHLPQGTAGAVFEVPAGDIKEHARHAKLPSDQGVTDESWSAEIQQHCGLNPGSGDSRTAGTNVLLAGLWDAARLELRQQKLRF
jgi:hypothetical protein